MPLTQTGRSHELLVECVDYVASRLVYSILLSVETDVIVDKPDELAWCFHRSRAHELRRDLRDPRDNRQLLGSVPGYKLHGRRFAFVFFRRRGSFGKSASTVSSRLPFRFAFAADREKRRAWRANVGAFQAFRAFVRLRLTRIRATVLAAGFTIHGSSLGTVTSIEVIVRVSYIGTARCRDAIREHVECEIVEETSGGGGQKEREQGNGNKRTRRRRDGRKRERERNGRVLFLGITR